MNIAVVGGEAAVLSAFMHCLIDSGNVLCSLYLDKPFQLLEPDTLAALDAVFLDIDMTRTDSVELAETLAAAKPRIQIVFLSTCPALREAELKRRLGGAFAGFCDKPFDTERLLSLLDRLGAQLQRPETIELRTFNGFDVFLNGRPVSFKNAKAKELLAILTDKNGAYLTIEEAAALLWPDKRYERSSAQYRDTVYRLRQVLRAHKILSLITVERAKIRLNKQNVTCDYWEYLAGNAEPSGSYMPLYEWAADTQNRIEVKRNTL